MFCFCAEVFRDVVCFVLFYVGKEYDEFFAAVACGSVESGYAFSEECAYFFEEFVSGRVSVRVVVVFEVVEVEHDDACRFVFLLCAGEMFFNKFEEVCFVV